MRKKIFFFVCLCFVTILCLHAQAEQSVYLGLENNRYIFLGYQRNGWSAELKNSVFIRNVDEQYIRATGGKFVSLGVIGTGQLNAFVGANYGARFFDLGIKAQIRKNIIDRLDFQVGVMPLYDSELKYNTCYSGRVDLRIFKEVSLTVDCTNIPEYRAVENRIVPGLIFNVGNLYVKPEISIPLDDNIQFSRVLVSFRYDFMLKSKR